MNFNSKLEATGINHGKIVSTPLCNRPSETWSFAKFLTKTLLGQTKIRRVEPMSKYMMIHAVFTKKLSGVLFSSEFVFCNCKS